MNTAILEHLQPRAAGGDRLYGVAVWRFAHDHGEDWYEAIIQPDFRVFRLVMAAASTSTAARPARWTVYLAETATAHTAGPPIPFETLPACVQQLCEEFAARPYAVIRDPRMRAHIHLSVFREMERPALPDIF